MEELSSLPTPMYSSAALTRSRISCSCAAYSAAVSASRSPLDSACHVQVSAGQRLPEVQGKVGHGFQVILSVGQIVDHPDNFGLLVPERLIHAVHGGVHTGFLERVHLSLVLSQRSSSLVDVFNLVMDTDGKPPDRCVVQRCTFIALLVLLNRFLRTNLRRDDDVQCAVGVIGD